MESNQWVIRGISLLNRIELRQLNKQERRSDESFKDGGEQFDPGADLADPAMVERATSPGGPQQIREVTLDAGIALMRRYGATRMEAEPLTKTDPGDPPGFARQAIEAGQRVIAILGMHRSGTSLLAGSLQECGLELGDVNTQAPANEKGNRESWLLTAVHEDVLRTAGGFWHRPPTRPVSWTPLHRAVRSLFIQEFRGLPLWGFKDPRSLLVLDDWMEAIPSLETVGIFRHPRETAESLRQRTPTLFPGDSALQLWLAYNRRLLAWHESTGCPLVEFVSDRAAFNAAAVELARRLDLPAAPPAAALGFYEDRLRHHSAGGEPLSPDVAEVYAALRARAARAVSP